MKILCFGRFYDETPCGTQKHVEQLFLALSKKVQYVNLVPSRNRGSAEFLLHDFPVIRTPSINLDGSVSLSPSLITKARQLHQSYQFDIIHLHFPDPMSHLASMILPSNIPRVISWHADIIRQKYLKYFYQPFLKHSLEKAAAIVVATPAHITNSPILSQLKNKNLHIIPYGFQLSALISPHPLTHQIKAKYPNKTIFALGRHVYYKGFDILIKALKSLPNDITLIIGGTGPLTQEWQTLAVLEGVSERTFFEGLIKDEDLPAYYQACDIFCLPAISPAEAFGIVQIEAMAAGKPVVSTRLNNGVDFVNQDDITGLTVPPNDTDSLAKALLTLLADPSLCKRLGQQAQQRALNEFSLEYMGNKMLHLYEQVIAQSSSHL